LGKAAPLLPWEKQPLFIPDALTLSGTEQYYLLSLGLSTAKEPQRPFYHLFTD